MCAFVALYLPILLAISAFAVPHTPSPSFSGPPSWIPGDDGITRTFRPPTGLQRRDPQAPGCYTISDATDYNLIPQQARDWLDATATEAFGAGGVIHYSPGERPEAPLYSCILLNQPPIVAVWESEPSCTTITENINGTIVEGDVDITAILSVGITKSVTASSEEMKTHTFSADATIKLKSPKFAKFTSDTVDGKLGYSYSIADMKGGSNTTSFSTTMTQWVTAHAKGPPGPCTLKVSSEVCYGDAIARMPVKASGTVWWYYNSPVKDHHWWGLDLVTISDKDLTHDSILKMNVQGTQRGSFVSDCA